MTVGRRWVLPAYAILPRANPASFNLLIERGARTGVRDKDGLTPLHVAARYRNVHAVQVLLAKGADVNSRAKYGNTPLSEAMPQKGGPTPDQQEVYRLIQNAGGK
jgi:ankyrin repeat protein